MSETWIDLLAATTFAVNAFGAVRLIRHRRAAQNLSPAGTPAAMLDSAPMVSILVPARNEAEGIATCVKCILSQDYPAFEVIVCDDDSTDATGAILDELADVNPRLRVVHRRGSPPPGWVGKNFALHTAYLDARGAWILCVDADCFLSKSALTAAMQRALHPADGKVRALVSVLPHIACDNLASRILMPTFAVWLSLVMPIDEVNDPRKRAALAAGGFLLIQRDALDAIGAYTRLAPHIVEDVLTAKLVKSSGRHIELFLGRDCVSTPMYDGWRDLWEGITKNAFAGVDFRLSVAAIGVLSMLTFAVVPTLAVGVFLTSWIAGSVPLVLTTMAATLFGLSALILTSVHAAVARELGFHALYGLLAAPGHLLYAAALTFSAIRGAFGSGVRWKGRSYYGTGAPTPSDRLLT